MKDKYIDLHVHSTASDGTYEPHELIEYAYKKKLSAIALTDHDTITGLKRAKKAGEQFGIEVISGIEFSTQYENLEVHILGLYIDEHNAEFINSLKKIITIREERNLKMIKNLNDIGVEISFEDIRSVADSDVFTRAHFANALLKKGYIKTFSEAFDKYIGIKCPGYVPRDKVTAKDAIKLINTYGGVSILAHPTLLHLDLKKLEALIKDLKNTGLHGIEAIYSLHKKSEEKYLTDLAKKYNLVISGGSDFHGTNKNSIDLGVGRGNLKIPYHILEPIKKLANLP